MRITCAPKAAMKRVAPAPASWPVKSQMRRCPSADGPEGTPSNIAFPLTPVSYFLVAISCRAIGHASGGPSTRNGALRLRTRGVGAGHRSGRRAVARAGAGALGRDRQRRALAPAERPLHDLAQRLFVVLQVEAGHVADRVAGVE